MAELHLIKIKCMYICILSINLKIFIWLANLYLTPKKMYFNHSVSLKYIFILFKIYRFSDIEYSLVFPKVFSFFTISVTNGVWVLFHCLLFLFAQTQSRGKRTELNWTELDDDINESMLSWF